MNKPLLLSAVICLPLIAVTQELSPSGFEQWPPASLKRFDQKMYEDAIQDPHHFSVEQLGDYPHDSVLLVHRESDGQVEWHETQVDVFFVLSGSATLVLGGTMRGAETVGPHEKRNGTISGGVRRKLARVRKELHLDSDLLLAGNDHFPNEVYFEPKLAQELGDRKLWMPKVVSIMRAAGRALAQLAEYIPLAVAASYEELAALPDKFFHDPREENLLCRLKYSAAPDRAVEILFAFGP